MALNPKMLSKMFKTSQRDIKNIGRMNSKDLRKEYSKQSKVANERIKSIKKAGYYSHALNELEQAGFTGKFGIKNQKLMTDDEIRTEYKKLMRFLNSGTSSKSGIRDVIDTTNNNFGLSFDGDYVTASKRNKRLFQLYEDLKTMYEQGKLKTDNKYQIVNELGDLWDSGELANVKSMDELIELMNSRIETRNNEINAKFQKNLNFQWRV